MRSSAFRIMAGRLRARAYLAGVLLGALLLGAPAAAAQGPAPVGVSTAPQWQLTVVSEPTVFEPGQEHDTYRAFVANVGGGPAFTEEIVKEENSAGEVTGEKVLATNPPITMRFELPEGVTVETRKNFKGEVEEAFEMGQFFGSAAPKCSRSGRIVTCMPEAKLIRYEQSGEVVKTEERGSMRVGALESMRIGVKVEAAAGAILSAAATVSGGGGEEVGATSSTQVAEKASVAAGVAPGSFFVHASSDQAGAHPNVTAGFALKTVRRREADGREFNQPLGSLNVAAVNTPPGLIGSVKAAPTCSFSEFRKTEFRNGHLTNACPPGSLVGSVAPWIEIAKAGEEVGGYEEGFAPAGEGELLYNMTPPKGVPAEFAFSVFGVLNILRAHVRSGGDYGLTVGIGPTSQGATVYGSWVTFFGVPARYNETEEAPRAFVYNPTACGSPLTSSIATTFFQFPSAPPAIGTSAPAVWRGCGLVPFEPGISVHPSTTAADSPTGLSIDLEVPQNEEPEGEGLASSDLKDATVTFPPGLVVNPSSADGLQGCSEEEVGFTGFAELDAQSEPGVKTAQFTPGPAQCPGGSKLGSVQIDTPLLGHPLPGALYLATPHANPFGSLIALYLTAYDPITGIVVKLPGEVSLDPVTGQLSTTFDQNPQLPFEELKVSLFGDPKRASLTTPEVCGSYATRTSLVPWSGSPAATPSSEPFQVGQEPGGGACAASEGQAPNAPAFEAGTASPIAGSYSPFVLKLAREDGSQRFSGLDVTLPPGLVGKIAGIEQCPQADVQAAERLTGEGDGAVEEAHPSCPAGSEVGVVHVGAGSGAPYFVTGHAYFAGPYKGAPFSLVFVTPAVAGPFDLGVVVVRAALFIDRSTAQVTVKSDPFPTILDGIPLDIRSVGVEVNRKEFMLNPTSCSVMGVTGQETSTAGQTAALSDRFQAGGCTTLPFDPSFEASSSGVTSRKDGASLVVRVGSGPGQANIAKVRVALPKQLPSRLETLKLACPEAVFAANPASCPAASAVGSAVAQTPLLASALTGPAYIVSHGGAAFPDLEVVLQGEGITLILDGKTDIKNGVTTSTFETVPDAPVSSFQLELPARRHSILSAPGGLCSTTRIVSVKKRLTVKVRRHGHLVKRHGHAVKRHVTRVVREAVAAGLVLPTRIEGQNGAVINEKTPLKVTGCKASTGKKHTIKHQAKHHRKHATKHGAKPAHKHGKKHG